MWLRGAEKWTDSLGALLADWLPGGSAGPIGHKPLPVVVPGHRHGRLLRQGLRGAAEAEPAPAARPEVLAAVPLS